MVHTHAEITFHINLQLYEILQGFGRFNIQYSKYALRLCNIFEYTTFLSQYISQILRFQFQWRCALCLVIRNMLLIIPTVMSTLTLSAIRYIDTKSHFANTDTQNLRVAPSLQFLWTLQGIKFHRRMHFRVLKLIKKVFKQIRWQKQQFHEDCTCWISIGRCFRFLKSIRHRIVY